MYSLGREGGDSWLGDVDDDVENGRGCRGQDVRGSRYDIGLCVSLWYLGSFLPATG